MVMDSLVRVKFRLVIPLVVGLAVVIWVIFHSRGNGQDCAKIQRMEDIIREKDVAIAQIKDQLRRQVTNTKIIVKSVEKQDIPVPVTKTPVLEDSIKTRPFVGEKLVHIDLKGGAPKMAYLLKLLPTLKSWGATGLLVEYEDMFPYDQDLSVLKSPFAYRVAEITKLLTEVKKHDLLLVPLVQTFGHMEFVLKHKKFAHLRHIANMTNSVNPTDSGSVPLVKSMVEQIIKLHKPYIKYLHIGGDEVWSLKNCENCEGASKVYINHMTPIIDHVWDNQVIPILWDDMMRNWTIGELKHISLKHVQPMVWGYSRDLNHYFPPGMWTRYGQAFDKIWFASAFKGADTPYTNFVPIKDRIENHESWLKINAELHAQKSTMKVLGIALTGWSRFDHDATLCELLPVSLPSLALCLAVVKEGRMSDQTLLSVSRKLGFRDQIVMNPRQIPGNLEKPDEGKFLGHSLFGVVLRLSRAHNTIQSVEARMLSWFNERQVIKKSISVYHLTVSLKRLDSALYRLQQVKDMVKKKFATFFNHDIIDEWTWDKIDSKRQRAIEIQQRLMKLKSAQSKNDRQSIR